MSDYKEGLLSESIVYCTALYMAAQNGHRDVVKFISELPINPIGSHLFKYTAFYFAAQNGHMRVLEHFARNGINFMDSFVEETTEDFEDTAENLTDEQDLSETLIQDNLDSAHSSKIPKEDGFNAEGVNDGNNETEDLSQQDMDCSAASVNVVEVVETVQNDNSSERADNLNIENVENNVINSAPNGGRLCGGEEEINVYEKIPKTEVTDASCNDVIHNESKAVSEDENITQMSAAKINDTSSIDNQIATTSKIYPRINETGQNMSIEGDRSAHINAPTNTDKEEEEEGKEKEEEKCENIFDAVQRGNVEQVRLFIENCLDINTPNENRDTLLHLAAARGDVDVLKMVLNSGANLKPKNKYGNAPIHVACELGNMQVVEEFLERGVKIGIVNPSGNAPIHLAAKHHHFELLKLLLDKGANIKQTNKIGQTYLHLIVENGCSAVEGLLDPKFIEIIEPLLKTNVDVNIRNNKGETALHIASQSGSHLFIEYLLKANIDVNIKNEVEETASFYTSDVAIIELLIESGVNLKLTNKDGETVLHNAAKHNYVNIVDYILKKQILDVDIISSKHLETSLYLAASHGHCNVIEVLLNYNATLNKRTDRCYGLGNLCYCGGFNALHVAVYNGHYSVVEILLENGMDVNCCIHQTCTRIYNVSPLMIAAFEGYVKIAELLLIYGANKEFPKSNLTYSIHVKNLIKNYESIS